MSRETLIRVVYVDADREPEEFELLPVHLMLVEEKYGGKPPGEITALGFAAFKALRVSGEPFEVWRERVRSFDMVEAAVDPPLGETGSTD